MTLVDALERDPEPLPDWLRAAPRAFSRAEFFGSRTLYYPGSGDDGQPVSLCARAHAAHAFVYVDYGVGRETISGRVHDTVQGFSGYAVEYEESLEECDLRPGGWTPHVDTSEIEGAGERFASATPYAWFAVLRRKDGEGYGDSHGPERLAGLFVGGDGFATFDALYCQDDGTSAPFLVVVQDHGFGGNHDKFGAGGILERIARRCRRRPRWLLVGENSDPWQGYRDVAAAPEAGGMHGTPRYLHVIDAD